MKRLIGITLPFGTVPAHATCNPHHLSAVAKMCRLEALSDVAAGYLAATLCLLLISLMLA